MAAARLAGMIAAKNAQIVKAPTATVNAGQSHQETPYSCEEIKCPAPIANGNPRSSPIKTL